MKNVSTELDELARLYTACSSFRDFADSGYCPTLIPDGRDAEAVGTLADAFDAYQESEGKPYRTWRGRNTKNWEDILKEVDEWEQKQPV